VRIAVVLYVVALVARLIVAAMFPDPAYPDSFYYVDVARQLAAGHGFNVDFIWIFAEVGGGIPANPTLPIPSNAHWMPLASLVQVPFIWLLGPTAMASAIPFAIAGAFSAPLAFGIGRDAGAPLWVSIGAGILAAMPMLLFPFMAQPDNFSLYQPLVAGSLWLAGRGLRGDRRSFAAAGLLAGFATLSRNDGVLVLAVLVGVVAWDRWRAWRGRGWRAHGGSAPTPPTPRPPRLPLGEAAASVGLFAIVVVPWYLRQLVVFGQLSPSTSSGKVLFIRDIAEWNSITTPASLDHLLGMGLGPLLATRIEGLIAAVTIFSVLVGVLVLVPFMLVGAWRRRRDPSFGPFLGYAGLLFAFSAVVSAVHVPGGTFIHSAVALAPHGYVLALEGIAVAVAWVAVRRPTWHAPTATRLFTGAAVAFALAAAAFGAVAVHGGWAEKRDRMAAVADALDAAGAPASDRLMSIDAAGYRYATGRGGVVLVNDPLDTVAAVARAYDIRWLILERGDSVPAVEPILVRGERPAWVGPPILELRDADANAAGDAAGGTSGPALGQAPLPDVAVYPVCLEPDDARCGTAGSVEVRS
jgi:hypothetical protein